MSSFNRSPLISVLWMMTLRRHLRWTTSWTLSSPSTKLKLNASWAKSTSIRHQDPTDFLTGFCEIFLHNSLDRCAPSYRPPIPGVRHSGGPPFRGSGLGLTLADPRNGGPPEWQTGIVRHLQCLITWKICSTPLQGSECPIPKVHPPRSIESDLQPILLTATLAKLLESFVGSWILERITSTLEDHQYGALKQRSTTHDVSLAQRYR